MRLHRLAVGMALTGDEGVEAFDAVDQAHLFQKGQSAIDGRRLSRAIGMEAVDDVVGLDRGVFAEDQLQRTQARGRHAFALRLAQAAGLAQARLDAPVIEVMGVVVIVVAGVRHAHNVGRLDDLRNWP